MVLCVFIFLFRSNSKKNTWVRTIFVMVMIIISKVPFWKLLDISCFQTSQQLQGTLATAIERHLRAEDFMDMDQHSVNSLLGKYHETKMSKGTLEIIKNLSLFFEEYCTKTFYLLLYSSFSLKQTWFLNSTLSFDTLYILEFIQCL